ncbi:MAG: hypothetical protein NVSMB47_04320 [Polyangiales bacterium]
MSAPTSQRDASDVARQSETSESLERAGRRWLEERPTQGVITCDANGRIRSWNRWLEVHTGRPASETLGRPLVEVFPELVERRLAHLFDEALAGQVRLLSQRLHGFLVRIPTHSGSTRFECMQQSAQIAPLAHEGRVVGTIATITDVTDRVSREADLQSEITARARLFADERAARTEADAANRIKDEFLAVLSHELRTPLHAILGWARLLREARVPPEKVAHGVAAIERNAMAQTQLIEDLLDVSRIVSGNLRIESKRVDLRRAIEAAVEIVRPMAEAKGVRLTVTIAPELAPMVGDAGRLEQIVWNLLGNSVKFTPPGGEVALDAASTDEGISMRVTDSGQGIAPEFLPHLFERFRQADSSATRPQGGLGLGLSIVKRLVELHGGTITATSDGRGRGASFALEFPHAAGSDSSEHGLSDPGGAAPSTTSLAGVRILVVDDDDDAREVMALALAQEGATVLVAGSAVEARKTLAGAQVDVLISDVGMPGEDGYALIRSVRASFPGRDRIPALALTGYAGLDDRARAREAGFDAHLTKPVDLDALLAQVAQLAHGHLER